MKNLSTLLSVVDSEDREREGRSQQQDDIRLQGGVRYSVLHPSSASLHPLYLAHVVLRRPEFLRPQRLPARPRQQPFYQHRPGW